MTDPASSRPETSFVFVLALVVLGVLISVDVVPGVFTPDENNYLVNVLALRQGRVTVANTEGLPPSRELLFFDPGPWSRAVDRTPVASTAPPLYALIALPFSVMGWRGLVALNTLAYLLTTALVFLYVRHRSTTGSTPWLAAVAFALCGYSIEYAQGVWPHALSVALCTAGILAAGRLIESDRLLLASAAGFMLAVATGVRYQNAIVIAAAGGGIGLWATQRWRALLTFGLSAIVPLSISSIINHARLGSWNPISKGAGYLSVPLVQDAGSSLIDPFVMFWARVVDYSARPPLSGPAFQRWFTYEPVTGAHLIFGLTLKKALLQSAPWAFLAMLIMVLAWTPTFRLQEPQRRQLRFLSLVTAVTLVGFALSGTRRDDGMAFNQRYLLEVIPLMAIAFAWALDSAGLHVRPVLIGSAVGVAIVLMILLGTPVVGGPDVRLWLVRQLALLKLPLFMAAALGLFWLMARARTGLRPLVAAMVGLCLGWSCTVHLLDDVGTSRRFRTLQLEQTQMLSKVLTNGTTLVAYWGGKDAAGPLTWDRDLVILDARADEGADAPMLIQELLRRNRKVFLLDEGFPVDVRDRAIAGLQVAPLKRESLPLAELSFNRP